MVSSVKCVGARSQKSGVKSQEPGIIGGDGCRRDGPDLEKSFSFPITMSRYRSKGDSVEYENKGARKGESLLFWGGFFLFYFRVVNYIFQNLNFKCTFPCHRISPPSTLCESVECLATAAR